MTVWAKTLQSATYHSPNHLVEEEQERKERVCMHRTHSIRLKQSVLLIDLTIRLPIYRQPRCLQTTLS